VRLQSGDTLAELERVTGVSWPEIIMVNGGSPATRATIDAWIQSVGGQPTGAVDDKGRPYWAFTPGETVLWLPEGSRKCECECDDAPSSSSSAGLIGGLLAAYLLLGD
jgi:hypothetical protein